MQTSIAGSYPNLVFNSIFTFYSITGQRLSTFSITSADYNNSGFCNGETYCTSGPTAGYLYLAGKRLMVADRLGSQRGNGQAYYPWGEPMNSPAPTGDVEFATYWRDMVGQDYADQRYYNSNAGRFYTPDGGRAINPADPGTWNRYVYASDDPVNFGDPSGLCTALSGTATCISTTATGSSSGSSSDLLDLQPLIFWPVDPYGGMLGGYFTTAQVEGTLALPPPPSCQDLLTAAIQGFLSGKNSPLTAYATQIVQVAQQDQIDPTLIAAIAIAENGQAQNNPFALGRNGSATYPNLQAAINAVGQVLDKFICTWNESTVAALWSGSPWVVDPRNKSVTIQPPAYCVGTSSTAVAACQNTGKTISAFMQTMGSAATVGGNPNKLGLPCPN